MKQVNFSHSGGFPLEQETLERLQKAYRSELYEALKGHLSIKTNENYIITHATSESKGWAVIHEDGEGTLYPILEDDNTGYLKTTRTGTNLVYGTGVSQIAYFDYEAAYISQSEFFNSNSVNSDFLRTYYYDLSYFKVVKDLQAIEDLFQAVRNNIYAIEGNINAIEADINLINQSYLPINGSKAMQGDLDLGSHQLSKLDIKESSVANVRVADFKLGTSDRRGLLHPGDYLGRALVDSSTSTATNLNLNYAADWQNTYIGGNVYLNNLNTNSTGSLLVLDNQNQVIKSDTLIESLINRITVLENNSATAVPIGMIAIWGKAEPIPNGWEEYVPLKGKMPVGLNVLNAQEKGDALDGDGGDGFSYYRDTNGSVIFPFEILGDDGGRMSKKLNINEIPPHTHSETRIKDNLGNIINYDAVGDDRHAGYETVDTGSTGGGQSFSILNPYRVVQFIEYTGRSRETTPPTKPLNLTVSNIGSNNATLSWTESTDNIAVTDYLLYTNGDDTPTPLGNVHSYPVTGLSPGTFYTFYVVAKDAAGNLSPQSNTVNVTTLTVDNIAPSIPTNLTCYLASTNQINIQWDSATDNSGGTIYYELWRSANGATFIPRITTTDNSYPDSLLSYNTSYSYKIRSRDASGNLSDFTYIVTEITDVAPGGGGGGCFDVESLVLMASGQSKKLKNIEIGDKLQGLSFPNEIDESAGDYMVWNGKLNEAVKAEVTVVNKRASLQPNYYEIKTADTTIKATGQHPLLITEDSENVKWVCVKNVSPDMLLIDKTGKTKTIESIIFKEEPLEVILLDVEDVDNYVISGIVAHNNKPEQEQ